MSQVYGFVRQSGGEVRVRSVIGEGSCFGVYLPITEKTATPSMAKPPDANLDARALRILLAEDDASVAAITEAMLVDLGHDVIHAASAADALRILRSTEPVDLLLSDVVMPGGMNGVDLAREAVVLRPNVRVLLNSGYAGESLDAELLSGALPFLRKPFHEAELAEMIDKLFGRQSVAK